MSAKAEVVYAIMTQILGYHNNQLTVHAIQIATDSLNIMVKKLLVTIFLQLSLHCSFKPVLSPISVA